MNLTVDRNELWRGIDTVLDAVPSRPPLPVLSNLLLEAQSDRLSIAATDLDLSIRTSIPASIDRPGSITVPARTFASIAREWPEAELTIDVEGERLQLSGKLGAAEDGEGAYTLSGMPADDFPSMPGTLNGLVIDLPQTEGLDSQIVGDMINKTAFAVSHDETRPVLNGVLWRIDGQGMVMVATDGNRLARCSRQFDLTDQVNGETPSEVIVPPQTLGHLVKLLGSQHELVKMTIGESQVLFDMGDTHLLSRLIEGPYVDYHQVIPQQNEKKLKIAHEHFLPAVRRVSILSSSYTHQVRMKLSSNSIELTATSQQVGGEARETIPATYQEDEMEVGYNANYLMEILRKMDASAIVLDLSDSVTAALLRPEEQAEGEDYFCLLMPLRPSG